MNVDVSFYGETRNIEINRAHYLRRLGFPGDFDAPEHIRERMVQTVEWYRKNGNPWLNFYELHVKTGSEELFLNGYPVRAKKILKRFKKYRVEKAVLIAATAGDKVEDEIKKLWSDYPDRSFFLETFASSVVEALIEFAVAQIRNWANLKQEKSLSRYSPGYPGWDLKEQGVLMQIIEETQNKIPLKITETMLLKPLKSQLSLVGIYKGEQTEKQIKTECMQCSFNNCSCRKNEIYIKE